MDFLFLTPREKQLLRRIARKLSDAEIAREIGGTTKQISDQRLRLLDKLRISSDAEVAEAAKQFAPWTKVP